MRIFMTAATALLLAITPSLAGAQATDTMAADADLAPAAAENAPASETPAPGAAETNPSPAPTASSTSASTSTYHQKDVLEAAESTFGKGAEGLAKLIEKIFREQGEPNGYIVGREAGGAILIGLRYGSGTLFHKVEGNLPVYWTGPSLGLDFGANGAKTFMLVYHLDNSEDLYKRFPGVEGSAYVIGGFTASHHRVGNVVIVPIHLGLGWRLGANVGYLKFTKTSKILPF